MANNVTSNITDLLIVGGGINGAGIAADATGRGLTVRLCEKNDFASATSSASTKLIHGGLRYLEHYEFRLVREALAEREVLLNKAPHLIKPIRFVLPHQKHLRPAWLIRCGLFLYDNLGGRKELAKSTRLKFSENTPFKNEFTQGFEYADCTVDDSRLVIANIIAAEEKGARIHCYTQCIAAHRKNDLWVATLQNMLSGKITTVKAKVLINASGPWAQSFLEDTIKVPSPQKTKLIKGSHIIIPRLYNGNHAYILQNVDNRVIFTIPYLNDFTLIGTTDQVWKGDPAHVEIDETEKEYLVSALNSYFKKQVSTADIVHHYAGVRPLCDDESTDPSAMTRDYTLEVQDDNGEAPLLSIFGGKITTYRRLSEAALEKIRPYFDNQKNDIDKASTANSSGNKMGLSWTKHASLPGGEIYPTDLQSRLLKSHPWLPNGLTHRLINTYGSRCLDLLKNTSCMGDLGEHLGSDLYEIEVSYLVENEWARTAEDILFRRTKLGLVMASKDQEKVEAAIAICLKFDNTLLQSA